jgi:phosphoribosylglycinamide formyltransferase 1
MGVKQANRVLFLASGRGSNFQALVSAIQNGVVPDAQAVGLICNRPEAKALSIAQSLGIPATVLDHQRFKSERGKWDRSAYDSALDQAIGTFQPDWVCLAGYMLLVGPQVVQKWKGKMVNIHPSLLPSFPGLNAQKQAIEAGVKWTGCTVHLVSEAMDAGPILEQSSIPIEPGETEASLIEKLLPIEHATYIAALKKLCTTTFRIENNRVVWEP